MFDFVGVNVGVVHIVVSNLCFFGGHVTFGPLWTATKSISTGRIVTLTDKLKLFFELQTCPILRATATQD
jgi:hypothetical protein